MKLRTFFSSKSVYVLIKSLIVNFLLLKRNDVVVQQFFCFSVGRLVESVRIGKVSGMKLKIRLIVDQ